MWNFIKAILLLWTWKSRYCTVQGWCVSTAFFSEYILLVIQKPMISNINKQFMKNLSVNTKYLMLHPVLWSSSFQLLCLGGMNITWKRNIFLLPPKEVYPALKSLICLVYHKMLFENFVSWLYIPYKLKMMHHTRLSCCYSAWQAVSWWQSTSQVDWNHIIWVSQCREKMSHRISCNDDGTDQINFSLHVRCMFVRNTLCLLVAALTSDDGNIYQWW